MIPALKFLAHLSYAVGFRGAWNFFLHQQTGDLYLPALLRIPLVVDLECR